MKQLFLLVIIGLLISCNSANKPAPPATDEQTEENINTYGEKISGADAISGRQLVVMLNEKDSVWVTLQSVVVTNCKSSGCWMDLDLGIDDVVKVTFKDYAFFIPLESEGKTATIEGFAKKEIIPVDLLKHYAEDEGKSQEEIDAITEPELAYTFEAIGVIIDE